MEQVQAAFEANRSRSHVSVFLFLGVHYSHFIFKRPGDTNHLVREDLTIPQDQSQDTPVVTKIIRSYLKSSARYVPDILVLNEPSIKVSKEESEEFHADLLEFVRSPFKDAISSIITEGTEGLARTTAKRLESAKSANESEFQPVPSSGTDDKSEGGRNLSMRLYKDDHDIADTPHEELLSRRGRGNPELAQISREALTLDEVAERRRMALQPRSSSTISGDQPHVPEVHNQEESVQDADDEGSGPDPLVLRMFLPMKGKRTSIRPVEIRRRANEGQKGWACEGGDAGWWKQGGSVSQAGKKKGSKA
ncbi:uncharacterized protein BXZ73DRAFT_77342 [Epithele typhae]|uniref:uncharacterized protein n=1 Tax=Epithele typhae TaxID=378194 RepID=UPI002007D901|nr:uncharacterized protein BXZ73DRAFT_77342 [Epithele typhae]KAH9933180.1 hypothetical protein BXZ73DRAFT_77342 [Epithele typhae]